MYYYRLIFIVPLVLCLIYSLSSSFNHNQQSSTSPSPPSSSFSPPLDEESSLGRTKPFLKQAIFNKFGLLGGGGGSNCCPCSDFDPNIPVPIPGDYPDPGLVEDPNGPIIPGLFNRFGATATLAASTSRRIVRRRYVRPNGLMVVEIEEHPGGYRGTGLFGGGLFSRFIPSALENGGNVSRRQQITQTANPIVNLQSSNRDRKNHFSSNNNQRRRIRIDQT